MAEPPVPTTANDWAQEMVRAIVRAFGTPDESEEVNKVTQSLAGMFNGTYWKGHEKARDELLKDIQDIFEQVGNLVGDGIGTIIGTYYGANVIGNSFGQIATGNGSASVRKAAGDAIVNEIFKIFDLKGVASGYRNRAAGTEEQENFARFVGLNWQIQMADLIAEMASKWVPWDVAGGVREIGDRIQKVLGLEDAQEEIMEPLMEKLIIEGLTKRFNRETLPTDLTPGDAVDAYIRGYLHVDTMGAILDNEGIRKDIRPILLNLKAKNLTEADFRDLYQRGVWTGDAVAKAYRENGYLEADAQTKTTLILHDREFQLRKELLNVKETQFAHGVLSEGDFRAYLRTLHFSAVEEEIEVDIAKGKASLSTTAKPKRITGSFSVTPERVKAGDTALIKWNIRNADSVSITGLGDVGDQGEEPVTITAATRFTLTASSDVETITRVQQVLIKGEELKQRPTASFSASPGRITIGTPVELKWETNNADSVSIDGIGPVAEAGAQAVYPFLSTVYTLRATNAQGTTIRQDIVFVFPPDFDLDKERRPGISFSITPTVVKASQPQAELNWSITRADGGTLVFPDGRTQDVSINGALIVTASASGIFTLKASNLFGESQNQEALIFQGADQEA